METSYVNKITGFVIALVLGAIMIGGLLAPTVAGIQATVGDDITKSNQTLDSYYRDVKPTDVFELSSSGFELNDVLINKTYRQAVFADSFVLQINKPSDTALGYLIGAEDATPTNLIDTNTYTVTFENKTVKVVKNDDTTVYTKEFEWAYIITTSADTASWGTISRIGTDTSYILNDSQVILSGYYYTGDNKTFYSYKDGELYTGSYEGAIEITKSIADGTTDIYKITGLEVTVGEESFTPYLTLVPLSVTGHATAGAAYVMFGVLTLLAIVMLVVISANAVRGKYN